MSKKDYELLADVVRSQLTTCPTKVGKKYLAQLARALAGRLKDDNEAFQTSKFLEACGVSE